MKKPSSPSAFKQKVIAITWRIPYGKVASYGQVAHLVGVPRGARQVGWILNKTEGTSDIDFPWWRVINNQGRISIKGTKYNTATLQKKLLTAEGLKITDSLELDIEAYRWHPSPEELKDSEVDDETLRSIFDKETLPI